MEFLQLLVVVLGLSLIICLVYLVLTGGAIPPGLKTVVLVAVALMFLLCILHTVGCRVPMPTS